MKVSDFVNTLNDDEKVRWKTRSGLLEVLSDKLKPQNNEMMVSLQYCKLTRQQNENADKWTGWLRIKANEFEYKRRSEAEITVHKWHN